MQLLSTGKVLSCRSIGVKLNTVMKQGPWIGMTAEVVEWVEKLTPLLARLSVGASRQLRKARGVS